MVSLLHTEFLSFQRATLEAAFVDIGYAANINVLANPAMPATVHVLSW